MHMHTDLKFMTVMQWMSPAFPIGAFAYSHGLEWAIDKDHVSNGEKLQKWITDLLEYGSLRTDAIFISLILRGHDVRKMNELSMALCPAGERLLETKLQGSAFAKVIEDVWQQDIGELSLPIAVALAAKKQSIEQNLILPAYLQAFCSNLISAAIRLIPIGQTEGQRIMLELYTTISDLVQTASESEIDDLNSACFFSDVSAMEHEYLQPRIFKT
jgi:urease accessory protein